MENQLLKKSGIIAAIVTFTLFGGWFGFSKLSLAAYNEKDLTKQFLGEDSKVFKTIVIEVGSDTVARILAGTNSMTLTGTASYPWQPRIEYDGATGRWSFKNSTGTQTAALGTVTAGYVAEQISSTTANYVLQNNGSSTGQSATDPTLAGQGTITATFNANGLAITPAEYASVNNATGELQSQITETKGSVTNHVHTGSDGTAKVSHTDLTPASKGTQTHTQLDDFVASKAQASGIASLDASSLVIQNPASASKTPGTSTIVMTGSNTNRIADTFLSDNITKLGTPTTNNISEGSTNKYYTDGRVNAAVGSLSVNTFSDVNIIFNENDFVKIVGGQLVAGSSTTTVAFSEVTGSATASQLPLISGLSGSATASQIPLISGISGSATQAQLPTILQLKATTTTTLTADTNGYLRLTHAAASIDGLAKLILHGNGTDASQVITNNSSSGIVVSAAGNAQIDTAQSVLGGASILFDGTTDYLAGSDTASVLLNQDFQLDLRVRLSSTGGQDFYYHQTDGANLCLLQHHSSLGLRFIVDVGGSGVVNLAYLWSPSINTWYALRVALDASENTYYLWVDGNLVRTLVDTDKPADYTGEFYFGRGGAPTEANLDGWMDEIILKVGTDSVTTTGTYTVTLSEYGSPSWDTMQYIAPQGAVMIEFKTPGTSSSSERSYTFFPGSITVFGGTATASIGSSTPGLVYGVPGKGASTFDAQNVHSVDEIKAGVKSLQGGEAEQKNKLLKMNSKSWHPKVRDIYILDAEAVAKDEYIRKDYPSWESANKSRYTTSVTMPGTGTVWVLDATKMLQDFRTEKELLWLSDLNQKALIQATQDDLESDKSITRLGFRVRDPLTPEEIKEGESINLMSLSTLIVDTIKAQAIEIGSLTAALENQKIAYNEEVDNLYKLVNAIIVALLAIGGVSGWSTMRTKRKGT